MAADGCDVQRCQVATTFMPAKVAVDGGEPRWSPVKMVNGGVVVDHCTFIMTISGENG